MPQRRVSTAGTLLSCKKCFTRARMRTRYARHAATLHAVYHSKQKGYPIMETSTIVSVLLSSIDNNPFRLVDKYPFVEEKLDALQRSIAAVGFWEGVIGRRAGNR